MAEAQALYVAFVVLALMNIATGMFVQASLSAHERQREKAPKLGACFSCSAFLAMGVGIRRFEGNYGCCFAKLISIKMATSPWKSLLAGRNVLLECEVASKLFHDLRLWTPFYCPWLDTKGRG